MPTSRITDSHKTHFDNMQPFLAAGVLTRAVEWPASSSFSRNDLDPWIPPFHGTKIVGCSIPTSRAHHSPGTDGTGGSDQGVSAAKSAAPNTACHLPFLAAPRTPTPANHTFLEH